MIETPSSSAVGWPYIKIRWQRSHPPAWCTSLLGVFLLAMLVAAGITAICPYAPRVHDEFSYLLSADTILHGRLANPTPAVWRPLQSFHVIMEPSYASKYPLGQGLVVALGWSLLGLPIAGSWLSAGFCAASMTWMLKGLTTRRWAMLGGVLVAMHPVLQTTWSQSLISGWLTAGGSALVAGGIFRLRRRVDSSAALWLGIGVAVLALTRPFEGLVCTLLSGTALWFSWCGRPILLRLNSAAKCSAAAAIPIVFALVVTGLQNQATTGSWYRLSYQVHEAQYGVAPLFVFGKPKIPELAGDQTAQTIRSFHEGWSLNSYSTRAGFVGWLKGIAEAIQLFPRSWGLFFSLVPLLLVFHWSRFRIGKWLAAMVAIQVLASSAVCWVFPHYLSPVLPWLVALSIVGMRHFSRSIRRWAVEKDSSVSFFQIFGLAVVVQTVLLIACTVRKVQSPIHEWAMTRSATQHVLEALPGKDLVLVRYDANHNVHQEWVYNAADIEESPVIWAREERQDWTSALINEYVQRRTIWLLEPDQTTAAIQLLSTPSDEPVSTKIGLVAMQAAMGRSSGPSEGSGVAEATCQGGGNSCDD